MVKVAGIGVLSVAGVAGACGGAYLLMREKTIGDRVSKSGFSLIKYGDNGAWKLAAKHLKLSDDSLPTDLTRFDSSITNKETMDLDKAKVALEKWCKDASSKELNDRNIKDYLDKIKSRCTTSPSNIKEKLKRENKVFTGNWSGKFDTLKTTTQKDTDLQTNLREHDNTITEDVSTTTSQKEKYSSALQKWCESKLDLKLEHNDFESIYPKVVSRCI